jgi:hypothetical protein
VTQDPGELDAPFSVRIGARPPDRQLWEGVPDWLLDPLLDWLEEHLDRWSVRQLTLRLRLSLPESDSPKRALRDALMLRARESENGRWDILDAIDFRCQHDADGDLAIPDFMGGIPMRGSEPLAVLNRMLANGGSAYRYRRGRLERRVDDTVVAAFESAAATANDEASMLLRRAWSATYGRDPEPSRAYGDAVRAVEAIACPLVLPGDPKPTLGKVIARLREQADMWNFILPGEREAAGITPMRLMLELLWTAQRSRHAGGPDTRDQLLTETEAAVSLAITLVQWFASGFVQRREDDLCRAASPPTPYSGRYSDLTVRQRPHATNTCL